MGEFETVMQIRDEVEGLYNCREFSQRLEFNASVKSNCAQPPPPSLGHCGAFAYLVSLGSGSLGNFAWPAGRAFAYSGATPKLLTRTWFHILANKTKHGGFYWKHTWTRGFSIGLQIRVF